MSAPLLPIFMKLEGRRCLVVGAGAVGLQKVQGLVECAAHVTVIAPEARSEIAALAGQKSITWHARGYRADDLRGQQLVIAATSDLALNHAVHRDATAAGILVNAVDDPPFCDFYFGSVVRRGPLQIGISTAGESPALAQRLRRELEVALDHATGPWLTRLGALRRKVLGSHAPGSARNDLLRALATREVCDAPTCPAHQLAQTAAPADSGAQRSWWLT